MYQRAFALSLLIGSSLWAITPLTPNTSSPSSIQLAKDIYVEGLKFQWQEQDSLANLYFREAALLDTNSAYLATLAFKGSLQSRDTSNGLKWAVEVQKRSESTEPSSAMFLALQSRLNNQLDTAVKYYEIVKKYSARPNLSAIQDLALCYQLQKKYDSSLTNLSLLASYADYPQSVINRFTQIAEYAHLESRIVPFFSQAWENTQDANLGLQYVQWLTQYNQDSKAQLVLNQLLQSNSAESNRYYSIKALLFERTQQLDSAYWASSQRTNIQQVDEILDLAKLSLRLKKPQESLKWLGLLPKDSATLQRYALSAAAYDALQMSDSAIIQLDKAVKISPQKEALKRELWELKSQNPNFQAGLLIELDQELQKQPAAIGPHQIKAKTLLEMAKTSSKPQVLWEQASNEYSYLSLLDSQNPQHLIEHADLLVKLNRREAAQQNLERAYKLDTTNAYTQNALGYFLVDQGIQMDHGWSLIQKARHSNPESQAIADSYAWALHKFGKHEDALSILLPIANQLNSKEFANWEYFFHLAQVYFSLGQKDLAKQWLETALKINPSEPALLQFNHKLLYP